MNRSGRSPKMSEWANRSFFMQIAHSLIFLQKTSDSLRKPISEFPALFKNDHDNFTPLSKYILRGKSKAFSFHMLFVCLGLATHFQLTPCPVPGEKCGLRSEKWRKRSNILNDKKLYKVYLYSILRPLHHMWHDFLHAIGMCWRYANFTTFSLCHSPTRPALLKCQAKFFIVKTYLKYTQKYHGPVRY